MTGIRVLSEWSVISWLFSSTVNKRVMETNGARLSSPPKSTTKCTMKWPKNFQEAIFIKTKCGFHFKSQPETVMCSNLSLKWICLMVRMIVFWLSVQLVLPKKMKLSNGKNAVKNSRNLPTNANLNLFLARINKKLMNKKKRKTKKEKLRLVWPRKSLKRRKLDSELSSSSKSWSRSKTLPS